MRSTIVSRIRPSQRAGRPLRATRSRVCHFRPSTSQGAFVSDSQRGSGEDESIVFDPLRLFPAGSLFPVGPPGEWEPSTAMALVLPFLVFPPGSLWASGLPFLFAAAPPSGAAFGSNLGRSPSGPAASTGPRNRPVWLLGLLMIDSGVPSATRS